MSATSTWVVVGVAMAVAVATAGCRGSDGGGSLHAQQVSLEREVEGLRERIGKSEGGGSILRDDAVVSAISESVVREFLTAQLPFDLEVQAYQISLKQADVAFAGTPSVTLTGTIVHNDYPALVGEVRMLGALEDVRVDPASGTLQASVAVDHIDLLQMAGFEKYLHGETVDELARTVRLQLGGKIPTVQIPVKIEQQIDLPEVTDGPVRLQGATMPLKVAVADVFASGGVLWVAIEVVPGEMVKRAPAAAPKRGRS